MQLDIKLDIEDVKRQLSGIRDQAIDKAAVQALNRVIKSTESASVKTIAKETGIKPQRKVRERLKIIKATRFRQSATLDARAAKGFNMIEFMTPSQRKVGAYKKQKGIKARRKGRLKVHEGAFVGRGKNSGKLLVFTRRASGKLVGVPGYPIKTAFIQKHIEKAMRQTAAKRWPIEFNRAIQFQLRKFR